MNIKLFFALLFLSTLCFASPDFVIKNQWYQVVYDEIGVATVNVGIEILNTGSEPINSISFMVPQGSFELKQLWSDEDYLATDNDNYYYSSHHLQIIDKSTVEEVDEGVYSIKIEPLSQGRARRLMLKYSLSGTAHKFLAFDYSFETLKFNAETEQMRVAVDVDENLMLSGISSERSFSSVPFGLLAATSGGGVQSSDMYSENFNSLQYARGLSTERRNLAEGNTLMVRGKYAESLISLYTLEILFGLIVLGALIYALRNKIKNNKRTEASDWKKSAIFSGLGIAGIIACIVIAVFIKEPFVNIPLFFVALFCFFAPIYVAYRLFNGWSALMVFGFYLLLLCLVPFLLFFLFLFLSIFMYLIPGRLF
ncbi:MAG: hypothetical protein ABH803_03195 [Candidatus Micrarchaeota archaeon]